MVCSVFLVTIFRALKERIGRGEKSVPQRPRHNFDKINVLVKIHLQLMVQTNAGI